MPAVATLSRPGKCAPRLIEDLIQYDPAVPTSDQRNLLIHPAVTFVQGAVLSVSPPPGSCRHKFTTKPEQSLLPAFDSKPDASTYYKIASYCSECRYHLALTVDFRCDELDRPCPSKSSPFHHLQHVPLQDELYEDDGLSNRSEESYDFRCTSPHCSATVTIAISPPRLKPEHVSLLTDASKIKERVQREIDRAPDRLQTYGIPEPTTVIQTLKQYLVDAMQATTPRRFPDCNKIFLTTLGEPCRGLLEDLGFGYETEVFEGEMAGYWKAPAVKASEEGPTYQDASSVLVDDVVKELTVLLNKRPYPERSRAKISVTYFPQMSMKDLERCLGCVDYAKTPASRRTIDLTQEENPYYAGLGALADFADDLMVFAYDRQREVDPHNASFYLECLQEIANARQSESLQTKVALIESSGEVSRRDIQQAYNYFQVDRTWDDNSIIGVFQARVADAPMQEAEARQCLRVIGVSRESESIQAAASNRVSTYEEALTWFGAQGSTPDEFIITLFNMKINENSADTELGREAVGLIAEKRNSSALRKWLVTGQLGEVEMDVGQAFTRLGIEDRTLEDDIILSTFQIRVSEAPSQEEELRSALRAIGKEKGSEKIASFLHTGQAAENVSSDWPVGLENIGNTCYLNSLLQFYFTVKPLRELIRDFHKVEMQINPASLHRKRVGSRKVMLNEIKRARKFVLELQRLFENLISAPTASIAPERELARLTLIKSADEEDYRRRSITSPRTHQGLGEIDGTPIQGPMFPLGLSNQMDVDADGSTGETVQDGPRDDASDVTLVNGVPVSGDGNEKLQGEAPTARDTNLEPDFVEVSLNKESQENLGKVGTGDGEMVISTETAEAEATSIAQPTETVEVVMSNDSSLADAPPKSQPPDRPPPVPPRPKSLDTKAQPVDELELGAQQDVTEVIGNVLFQLECAMRPTQIDDNGEQLDEIKQLFYGKLRAFIEVRGGQRVNEEYFSDIKVNVASGPRDIYAALDGAFDVQEVVLKDGKARQYTSIANLPPILQIQVQRVQYDVKNKKVYKSDAHLGIKETIFLDRYMDSKDPALLQKRQETWRWKAELEELEATRAALNQIEAGMSLPEVLTATKDWLEDVRSSELDGVFSGDDDLAGQLACRAEEANRELERIETAIDHLKTKIDNQFVDLQDIRYRLAAVFIHRGTATFGHYWIYIYDFKYKMWRKYNDSYVTQVHDESEIFEQEARVPATPYYLVYVKDELKESIIEPVHRVVKEPEVEYDAGGNDVEMQQQEWPPNEENWGGWHTGDGAGGVSGPIEPAASGNQPRSVPGPDENFW